MFEEISPERMLSYPQEPLEFAQLGQGASFFEEKGLTFEEGADDLDVYVATCVELPSGRHLGLMSRHQHPDLKERMGLIVSANERQPIEVMDEFIRILGEDRSLLFWLLPELTSSERWVLVRTEADGTRLIAGHFWTEGQGKGGLDHYQRKFPEHSYALEIAPPICDDSSQP